MKEISLRQSIFRVILGGIIVTALLILIAVWTSTSKLVNEQISRSLTDAAKEVFPRYLNDRRDLLINSGGVLTADFGYKQAVATGDVPTIESALANHGNRIQSDFMLLTDLTGKVITSQPSTLDKGSAFLTEPQLANLTKQRHAQRFVTIDSRLYQLIIFPVRAPRNIAYTGIGFSLGDSFLTELVPIVQADIILFQQGESSESKEVLHASINTKIAQMLISSGNESLNWRHLFSQGDKHYAVRELQLEEVQLKDLADSGVKVTLAYDLSDYYQSLKTLLTFVFGISALAIVILSVVGLLLSRRVSQPLDQLVVAVDKVAEGNYDLDIDVSGRVTEICHLTHAFDTMKDNIKSREERITFQAQHDMLTGLYNRNHIEQIISRRLQGNAELQIIGINIIGFRTINDLYGYANGDKCLRTLADRLSRWGGEAARLSGGEILWLADKQNTEMQLDTLRHILEQSVEIDDIAIPIKVVLAEIRCPQDARTAEEVFRKLNIVVDEAQNANQWLMRYNEEFENRYLRRLSIITELKQALMNDQSELSMVYQPKINLKTKQIMGFEALMRWNSSVLGFVPPDEFIGVAEHAGLIEHVTLFVVQRTLNDLLDIRRAGYSVNAAINLSSHDIQNKGLLEKIQDLLQASKLSSKDVSFEITESDLVEDPELAISNLNHLRSMGFALAIDDFGTGYSSLAYLKNLPVETIKIDKSFVLNLPKDKDDQQIVKTVLNLASLFELSVVAEGIEDEATLDMLTQWGCDYAQGYFISRPLALEQFVEWLHSTPYCREA